MEDHLRPAWDENTLDFPDSWLSRIYPRRGGRPGPQIKVDRSAAATVRERFGELEASSPPAERKDLEAGMAEAARDYLAGGADPLGAAVVAALLAQNVRKDKGSERKDVEKLAAPLVDSWVTEHGLPFAACAFTELSEFAWAGNGLVFDRDLRRRGYGRSVNDDLAKVGARLRGLLAAATDEDYRRAQDRLAECRRTPPQRIAASFLVPTRHDWVEECLAAVPQRDYEEHFWWMLCSSLSTSEHVDLAIEAVRRRRTLMMYCGPPVMFTLLDGVGPAVTPLVAGTFDLIDPSDPHVRKIILEMLALLPNDEAFQALMDRADQKNVLPTLLTAMKRFPVRALRLLAPAVSGAPKLKEPLAAHVRANRALVAEVLPDLPAEVAEVVGPLAADHDLLPDAPADVLPWILLDPPWSRTAEPPEPAVVSGLRPPEEPAMRWAPGERDGWLETAPQRHLGHGDWDELIERFLGDRWATPVEASILIHGPEDRVGPLVAGWKPRLQGSVRWMKAIVARFGSQVLPLAMSAAEDDPLNNAGYLLPYLDAGVAQLMTECLDRQKTRQVALDWLDRHGLDAVPLLVPAAVGDPGTQRRRAQDALRLLAARHETAGIVEAAARAHGDEAAGIVEAMLVMDPLEVLPARMPVVGEWADTRALPQIRLRDRQEALPAGATDHLLMILALSTIDEPYPGVEIVKELCDPESLAAFGWALFQQWDRNGGPPKGGWALTQLGLLGDDETATRLTPLIRAWPGQSAHHKAVKGLDILAAIGTEMALARLYGIAQKVKFQGIKARAQEKMQKVADNLGLTFEQLGDRLVPDFGLDAGGGLVLDYGPRRFLVGFDEELKPQVFNEDGTHRKSLPRPGVEDDQELAPAAYKRFTTLKKDVRTVAGDQIRRLERAMVAGRHWTAGEFRRLFVEHPLIWHIARRLVWIAEDGGKTTTFRVAEDRTFADADEDVLTLPEPAVIRIPHPVELGEAVDTWSAVLADYEILQPFPQLGRAVYTLTDAERASRRLDRFQGGYADVLVLERRGGWQRTGPMDAGIQHAVYREVPGDLYINVRLSPGIAISDVEAQDLQEIWLDDHSAGDYQPKPVNELPFGDLDPITTSEVLAELTDAMAAPASTP